MWIYCDLQFVEQDMHLVIQKKAVLWRIHLVISNAT